MALFMCATYRAAAIRFGMVRLVRLVVHGAWGHAPPEIFWNSGIMRLLLRPFLGQYNASWRPDDKVSHECHSAHCIILHWCRLSDPVCLSAESQTLCRWSLRDWSFAFKSGKLLEGRPTEQFCCTVRSHLASFNTVPMCFGALCGRPLSNGANWQRQASHEWGKRWTVETGLTGLPCRT